MYDSFVKKYKWKCNSSESFRCRISTQNLFYIPFVEIKHAAFAPFSCTRQQMYDSEAYQRIMASFKDRTILPVIIWIILITKHFMEIWVDLMLVVLQRIILT